MKSRSEFTNEADYREYLKFYYAGLAMQSVAVFETQNNQRTQQGNAKKAAETALSFADELIKLLMPDKK